MQEILDCLFDFHTPPLDTLSPENARNLPSITDAAHAVIGRHLTKRALRFPETVGRVEHILIPGAAGPLLARLYYPDMNMDNLPSLPVLLYFHGGGWVLGTLDTYDSSCRALCNTSQFIVVSVAYRQAPEHPFPAAANDAFAAYRWILENAQSFGGNRDLVAVAGESAGGNLAAVVCLKAKELGIRQPIHQLLIYPVTDVGLGTSSHLEFRDVQPLNEQMMIWFRKHYLPNELDHEDPFASPLRAKDVSGLPSTTIITAEIDPLSSDGDLYAQKLVDAGVMVTKKRFLGVTHEFFGLKALLPESREAVDLAGLELKSSVDRATPSQFSAAV